MPAHDTPYVEPARGQNPRGLQRRESLRLGPIAGDRLAGAMPLRAGHRRRVVTRHLGRRPDASLPGPAPAASATGGRSPGSPAPGPPDVGMVRAAVACAVIAMAGPPPLPAPTAPARDRPQPGPEPAGMARPGLGQSGSVSCLTVPLPVRACQALVPSVAEEPGI